MLVIYETFINDNGVEDEVNIYDCNTLAKAKLFLKLKRGVDITETGISQAIHRKSLVSKKYKIFKYNYKYLNKLENHMI